MKAPFHRAKRQYAFHIKLIAAENDIPVPDRFNLTREIPGHEIYFCCLSAVQQQFQEGAGGGGGTGDCLHIQLVEFGSAAVPEDPPVVLRVGDEGEKSSDMGSVSVDPRSLPLLPPEVGKFKAVPLCSLPPCAPSHEVERFDAALPVMSNEWFHPNSSRRFGPI